MRSRPKDLGTKHETRIVRVCQDAGLIAERIVEGGMYDLGDVRIITETDQVWFVESKNTMQLNIHDALEKAILKSGSPNTVVWWRRMHRKNGNTRRTQMGVPVVAMTPETFLELLGGDCGR